MLRKGIKSNKMPMHSAGLPRWLSGEEFACQSGDLDSIPGSGRSPGEGNGNPLQYSCLENPMDREAWRGTVHGVAKSQVWWSSTHTHTHTHTCSSPSWRHQTLSTAKAAPTSLPLRFYYNSTGRWSCDSAAGWHCCSLEARNQREEGWLVNEVFCVLCYWHLQLGFL